MAGGPFSALELSPILVVGSCSTVTSLCRYREAWRATKKQRLEPLLTPGMFAAACGGAGALARGTIMPGD
jgi:hypothetical protein